MRRRQFIKTLGGGAAFLASPAHSQHPNGVRRLGVMMGVPETDAEGLLRINAFRNGLRELGWVEDRNIRVSYRWAGADLARMQQFAKELVQFQPDVILCHNTRRVETLLQETRSIPIVFVAVADPVGSGFVQSMSRPGGNATGFTNHEPTIASKWLELLKEIAPAGCVVIQPRHGAASRSIFLRPV